MNFRKLLLLVLSSLLLYSCQSNVKKHQHDTVDELGDNYILKSTIEVFNTLPTPAETAGLIEKAGVKFDEKIINPVRNAPYYETSFTQALNMGVYCADLSYTTQFDQKQITMEYLGAIKLLADDLNLVQLITKDDLIEIEENLYNSDSIQGIVQEIFLSSGEILNDNKRPEIALLIQVGGWVEGLYIAMQLAKQSGEINKELVDRVVDQYNSLLLVIESLENFANIELINDVLIEMNTLKSIYDKMIKTENRKLNLNDELKLNENTGINVTPEIFMNLYHQIIRIRNSYTQ